MSRFRPRALTVVATIFVVTGLGLMFASLRIESDRVPAADASGEVVVPTLAAATKSKATVTAPPSDVSATKLFVRAQAANRTLAYGGVKEVSRSVNGKQVTVVLAVDHVPGRGTLVSQVGATSSPTSAASATSYTVEPAADDENVTLAALVRNYRLTAGPDDRLLGRTATTIVAHRADDSVAARFWIDDETGLVLRRELTDADGTITETATYTKVDFAPHATGTPTASAAPVWSVVDEAGVAELRSEGWSIPASLSDGLTLYQVRHQTQANGGTLQLSYTDGLVGLSVFQQRGVLDRAAMNGFVPMTVAGGEVWARTGTLFFTWQSRPTSTATSSPSASTDAASARDIVVSALADSPSAPVGAALTAFPPLAAEEAGVGDHLTRGVQRVGSWIDPLG